jgi:diadenosine tetraphosphate (Ap4A) HIT family hydrolase
LELQAVEGYAVVDLLRRAAAVIDRVEQRPRISVRQNNGVDAQQAIPHVHFHVAGTVDGGSTERGKVTERSVTETDAIASRLRPFF